MLVLLAVGDTTRGSKQQPDWLSALRQVACYRSQIEIHLYNFEWICQVFSGQKLTCKENLAWVLALPTVEALWMETDSFNTNMYALSCDTWTGLADSYEYRTVK